MQKLSGIDASFLYMETESTPMHVAGLTMYEPPEGMKTSFHEHFKTFFAGRLHLIPIFNKKLAKSVFQLDHPGWVDVVDVDLDYHIQGHKFEKAASFAEVEALVAKLHAEPLDRTKPLWQFTVFDNLESGQVALYSKVHHAAIDGGAGMVITQALYDLTPEPRKVDVPPKPEAPRKPSVAERAILGMHDLATGMINQQIKLAETVPQTMSKLLDLASSAVTNPAGLSLPQIVAPKTPFNRTLGKERSYGARSVSLIDAKAISKATGAKINDIVMAICAGALRAYLIEKQKLPDAPLVAFVPISMREAGNTDLNNQVFGMNTPLATNYADPLKRLRKIQQESTSTKTIAGSVKDSAPTDFTLLGAPTLLPGLMQLYGRTRLADMLPNVVNVTISNTAGPPFPMYCAGAKVTALYPVSIATHGIGLNFTVQSYLGNLDFGITAGAKAVPDMERMADLLVDSFEELKAACSGDAVTEVVKSGTTIRRSKPRPKRDKPRKVSA